MNPDDFFDPEDASSSEDTSSSEDSSTPDDSPSLPPQWADLQKDLTYYATYLQGISHEVLDSGTSKYPVFVAYANGQPDLGRPLLDHRQLDTRWSIRVSVMEEFVRKSILSREQFQAFKQSWKDPNDFICVFVADPQQAAFVYFPYPVAEGGDEI
jgi:hypothetical protein